VSAAYGVTITGAVATLTLTVPALWLLSLLVLSGLFMVWTTTRDWLASVIERVRSDDVRTKAGRVW
jgi:Ca2+/H+ antiporter